MSSAKRKLESGLFWIINDNTEVLTRSPPICTFPAFFQGAEALFHYTSEHCNENFRFSALRIPTSSPRTAWCSQCLDFFAFAIVGSFTWPLRHQVNDAEFGLPDSAENHTTRTCAHILFSSCAKNCQLNDVHLSIFQRCPLSIPVTSTSWLDLVPSC